jgi:hypothetical protein
MNHSTIQRIEGGWRIVTGDLVTVFCARAHQERVNKLAERRTNAELQ